MSDVTFDPVILNPKILCDFRTGHFLTNFPPRTLTFSNQLVTEPPTGHFLFRKWTPRDNACRIISGTCGVDYQKTIIPALLVKVGAALLHPLPGRRLRGGPCRPQRPTFPLNQADRAMHGNPLRAHGPELQVDGHMAVFHTGQAILCGVPLSSPEGSGDGELNQLDAGLHALLSLWFIPRRGILLILCRDTKLCVMTQTWKTSASAKTLNCQPRGYR